MESNLNIKKPDTPKLNIETVSSAVFGKEDGAGVGSGKSIRNIHKTLSKLSGHIRKSLIRIKALEFNLSKITPKVEETEKKVIVNTEKITRIKKILKEQKSNIGKKLPGSNQDDLNKSLIETNKILVGIQQQLALQSSNEQKEQKRESEEERRKKSRGKLKAEESALEKSGKRIGKAVGKVASKILSPIKGLFDQVLDFILTLGAGVAVNAAFEWLSKEENRKKVENAFEYVKKHWKWIAGVAAGIVLFGPAVSLITSIVSLAGALLTVGGFVASILGAPAFLTLLGILTSAGGIAMLADAVGKSISGGKQFAEFDEAARQKYLRSNKTTQAGVVMDDDGKSVKFKDALGNKTLMGSVTTERDAIAKGEDPDEYARKMGMALPSQVKAYLGEEKYNETLEAVDAFQKAMKDKDAIKNRYFKELDKVAPKGLWDPTGYFRMFNADDQKKAKVKALDEKYNLELAPLFERLAGERAMGGPVTAGKPYLVGERGPEIFAPNVDGSVINNMRTEKIYQMISSKRKGRGGIDMITLPPITNQMPPPEIPVPQGPATEVPDISSVNMADPYRQITPMLYGITV